MPQALGSQQAVPVSSAACRPEPQNGPERCRLSCYRRCEAYTSGRVIARQAKEMCYAGLQSPMPASGGDRNSELSKNLAALFPAPSGSTRSVVITCLQKVYPLISHTVYQSVFLRNSPRPAALKHVSKGLRLSHSLERITKDGIDQIEDSQSCPPIGFDPVPEVFAKLFLEHSGPFDITSHSGSRLNSFTPVG